MFYIYMRNICMAEICYNELVGANNIARLMSHPYNIHDPCPLPLAPCPLPLSPCPFPLAPWPLTLDQWTNYNISYPSDITWLIIIYQIPPTSGDGFLLIFVTHQIVNVKVAWTQSHRVQQDNGKLRLFVFLFYQVFSIQHFIFYPRYAKQKEIYQSDIIVKFATLSVSCVSITTFYYSYIHYFPYNMLELVMYRICRCLYSICRCLYSICRCLYSICRCLYSICRCLYSICRCLNYVVNCLQM